MKKLIVISYILALCFSANAQRPPSISSPDVHADHSITFRYYSRTANNVTVRG